MHPGHSAVLQDMLQELQGMIFSQVQPENMCIGPCGPLAPIDWQDGKTGLASQAGKKRGTRADLDEERGLISARRRSGSVGTAGWDGTTGGAATAAGSAADGPCTSGRGGSLNPKEARVASFSGPSSLKNLMQNATKTTLEPSHGKTK